MQKLTATSVKRAKLKAKPYSIVDGGGLYLLIKPAGKYWRYNYRFRKKQKTLALGVYPEITLSTARKLHREAREQLAEGFDPSANKLAEKISDSESFELVALEWLQKRGVKSDGGDKRLNRLLRKDLFPFLGKHPISEINAPS